MGLAAAEFARLDQLGLAVVGQGLSLLLRCLPARSLSLMTGCRRCGRRAWRDTVIHRLAHEQLGWRLTGLEVTIRRYRCSECGRVWRLGMTKAAEPRAKLSGRGLR